MSLQIWLPLINDLHNQGLNSSATISGGSKQTSGGKLGAGHYTGSIAIGYGNGLASRGTSVTFWMKPTVVTGWNTYFNFSNNGDTRFYIATNNSHIYPAYAASGAEGTTTLTTGTWYHIAMVAEDNGVFHVYLNGNLEVTIGAQSAFNFEGNANLGGQASYNDFRIYKKALSLSEVKEISKGLVAHYTLSQNSIVNKNILGSDSYPTNSSVTLGTYYTVIKESSDFFGLQAGDTFTVSYYLTCPSAKGGKLRIQYYKASDDRTSVYGTAIAAGQSGLVTYTATLSSTYRAYTKMQICIQNEDTSVTSNDIFYVRQLKIEKFNGNTAYTTSSDTSLVYDSSGYSGNLTITGNVNCDSNTPRYDKAIQFPANETSILSNSSLSIDPNAWTISFWEKCDWTNVETSRPQIVYWGNSIRIIKYSTNGRMRALYYYKDSEGTKTSALPYFMNAIGTDTSWKCFTLTFDGSTIRAYLNGTLNTSANLSSGFSLYDIGGNFRLNQTAETIPKSLSDVRVYATALSADDVKDLYNLGASIS